MTAIVVLHLRRLLRQPLRSIVALVAIAGAVALSLGVAVAFTSVERSLDDVGDFVTGTADLRITGPVTTAGLDERVVDTVAAIDGVEAVAPIVSARVEVADAAGDRETVIALGVDCAAERMLGAQAFPGERGCDPQLLAALAGSDTPLLSTGLADRLGEGATIYTDARAVPLDGAPAATQLDAINAGRLVIWPLTAAQRLLGREQRLDVVLVSAEPGADVAALRDRIATAVGSRNQVAPADEPGGSTFITQLLLPGLLLTSVVGLTVGLQLAHTTFVLTLEARRRELAIATAMGATPRLTMAGMLVEAATLGAVGGLLGTAASALVGDAFLRSLQVQVDRIAAIELRVFVSPAIVAAGVALGIACAVLAAIRPARAALQLDLAAELSERERHVTPTSARRRALVSTIAASLLGLFLGWLGWRDGALADWQPAAALAGMVLVGVFTFRLPGLLAADGVRLAARLAGDRPGPTSVALAGLAGDRRRTSSMANALGVAAALTATIGVLVPSLAASTRNDAKRTIGDLVTVSVLGLNNAAGIASKLPPDAVERLRRVPGVSRVDERTFVTLVSLGVGPVALVVNDALTSQAGDQLFRGRPWREARLRGEVMVGPALARSLDLEPGDEIVVPGIERDVVLVVGGIWASPENVGASITLNRAQLEQIAGDRASPLHVVTPEPGVSSAVLAARIEAAGLDPRLEAFDPPRLRERYAEEISTFIGPFVALQRAMLLVAFIATTSTLLLAAVQRRRELATLAAVGMSPADLGRMTLAEAVVLAVIASVVGIVSGLVAVVAFVFLSPTATGLPFVVELPWTGSWKLFAVILVVAAAGAALPAWRSTRTEPALALRYE